jgi:hypothetical protein
MNADRRRARVLAAAWLVVAGGALLLAYASASHAIPLPNDAVGYVAVARSWLAGRGLVDPVVYSYYLPGVRVPVAALLVRPPLVSILFALPLALGAGLGGLTAVHAAFASAIGASSLLVARRTMRPAAAVAAAAAIAWSPAWTWASVRLLSEASAVGMLLLLLGVAPPCLRSVRGALALALATVLAWLTRPNLGAFAPLLVAAVVLDRGSRAAWGSAPLRAYVAATAALYAAVTIAARAAWGFAPYAHYGVMAETLRFADVARFPGDFPGAWPFLRAHAAEWVALERRDLALGFEYAFANASHLHVGWLAVPGVAHGLLRRGPASLEQRLVALCAIGFSATGLATGWGFDPTRYLLPGAVCGWLAALAFLDDAGDWVVRRASLRANAARLARAAPALAVLTLAGVESAPRLAVGAATALGPRRTPAVALQGGPERSATTRALCAQIAPGARVASPDPWAVLYWCGHDGYSIPRDLGGGLDRYLDEMQPGYLIEDRPDGAAALARSARLEVIARAGPSTLFRVRGAVPEAVAAHPLEPLARLAPAAD